MNLPFAVFVIFLSVCNHGAHGQSIAKHVVHIGVDGLRPDCMNNAPGGNPNIMNRIAAQGTYTLTKGRTVIETVSAPGWTANLCAMDSTRTGIVDNDWDPPWQGDTQPITPVTGNGKPFPCVFQAIKEQSPNTSTASWYSWIWLIYLHNDAVPGSVDMEHYCADTFEICDELIAVNASQHLRNVLTSSPSSYHFIYFGDLDEVGHTYGWCSEAYLNSVAKTDRQIGQVLDAIDAENKQNQTLVFLSTDHGGEGTGHGCKNDTCLHIPIMVRGPGVKVNTLFTKTVSNLDVVPTAMYALGLQPDDEWTGKIMKEAFY